MAKSQERTPADVSAELAAAYAEASSAAYCNYGDSSKNMAQALADVEAARQKAQKDVLPFLGEIATR